MQRLARQRAAGFTLIELLVVLVVIGIAVGLVLLSPNVIREPPPLQVAVNELAARIALARDEAALQGRNLGIRFYPDGYEFFDLDPDNGVWTTLQGDELLGRSEFADGVLPALEVEDRAVELTAPTTGDDESDDDGPLLDAFGNRIERAGDVPHVVILASGEVTPFVVELERIGTDGYVRLEGDFFGSLDIATERTR